MGEQLRRATDHRFPKRFLLIPIIILFITVVGFFTLKASNKKTYTETATASVDFKSPNAPASKVESSSSSDPNRGVRLQLSLERERTKQRQWYAQLMFSGMMAIAALYVILSKNYPDAVDKWAYSTIAFIMGFWLQGL